MLYLVDYSILNPENRFISFNWTQLLINLQQRVDLTFDLSRVIYIDNL